MLIRRRHFSFGSKKWGYSTKKVLIRRRRRRNRECRTMFLFLFVVQYFWCFPGCPMCVSIFGKSATSNCSRRPPHALTCTRDKRWRRAVTLESVCSRQPSPFHNQDPYPTNHDTNNRNSNNNKRSETRGIPIFSTRTNTITTTTNERRSHESVTTHTHNPSIHIYIYISLSLCYTLLQVLRTTTMGPTKSPRRKTGKA